MGQQILFGIMSALTLITGLIVVTSRNLFHAALAMMVSFLGVAGLYLTLDAGFMAAAQLLVYIGAISILVIFAIMMTRRLMAAVEPSFNSQKWLALFGAILSFLVLALVMGRYWPTAPDSEVMLASQPVVRAAVLQNSVVQLGQDFVSRNGYVLPFEIASVLLLAAMIGSIVIAWPQTREDEL